MTNGITLTRNGYGNWFIKNTDYNETPEKSAAMVKWSAELNDDVDADD